MADDWDARIEREIARLEPTFKAIIASVTAGATLSVQDKEDLLAMIQLRCWQRKDYLAHPAESKYYFSRLACNVVKNWITARMAKARSLYAEVSIESLEAFDALDLSTVNLEAQVIAEMDSGNEISAMRNQLFEWLLNQAARSTPAAFEKTPYVRQVLKVLGLTVAFVFDVQRGQSSLELV